MKLLTSLAQKYVHSVPPSGASNTQYVILMVLNVVIWIAIGLFIGILLAVVTFLLEPQGEERGQVALVVLFVTLVVGILVGLGISISGLRRHFSSRNSDGSPADKQNQLEK